MTKLKQPKIEKVRTVKVPRVLAEQIVALMERGSALIQSANHFGSHSGGDKFADLGSQLDMVLNPKKYPNPMCAYARPSVAQRTGSTARCRI